MLHELRASLGMLVIFTLLTGIGYPWLITAAGQTLFPYQANGSLERMNGKIVGSTLIGQSFPDDKYFHSRPSAAGNGYDAGNSAASNLAPSAPDLIKTITARVADLRAGGDMQPIPVDLVTASGSGLDPDISRAAADYQAARVAAARHIPVAQVQDMVAQYTTARTFGMLGENRVNVLAINRALDQITAPAP